MARLADCLRIATAKSAVWRRCAGCTVLAPLAPDQTHCQACRPAAPAVRPTGRN